MSPRTFVTTCAHTVIEWLNGSAGTRVYWHDGANRIYSLYGIRSFAEPSNGSLTHPWPQSTDGTETCCCGCGTCSPGSAGTGRRGDSIRRPKFWSTSALVASERATSPTQSAWTATREARQVTHRVRSIQSPTEIVHMHYGALHGLAAGGM